MLLSFLDSYTYVGCRVVVGGLLRLCCFFVARLSYALLCWVLDVYLRTPTSRWHNMQVVAWVIAVWQNLSVWRK